jgi:serine/threonine-protein kinase HipA
MNRSGEWRLSPAFDISYSYDPNSGWTGSHQMSINGKRDTISSYDLCSLAKIGRMKANRACEMLDHVIKTLRLWPEIASKVGVAEVLIQQIRANQCLSLLD